MTLLYEQSCSMDLGRFQYLRGCKSSVHITFWGVGTAVFFLSRSFLFGYLDSFIRQSIILPGRCQRKELFCLLLKVLEGIQLSYSPDHRTYKLWHVKILVPQIVDNFDGSFRLFCRF